MAEREAPQLPLRGARGSAARFSAMALARWASPVGVQTGVECLSERSGVVLWDGLGRHRAYPSEGPRERCPSDGHALMTTTAALRKRVTMGTARGMTGGGAVVTPAGGPRKRCPIFGHELSEEALPFGGGMTRDDVTAPWRRCNSQHEEQRLRTSSQGSWLTREGP